MCIINCFIDRFKRLSKVNTAIIEKEQELNVNVTAYDSSLESQMEGWSYSNKNTVSLNT